MKFFKSWVKKSLQKDSGKDSAWWGKSQEGVVSLGPGEKQRGGRSLWDQMSQKFESNKAEKCSLIW